MALVRLTHHDRVAELELNRPESLNAFTIDLHTELADALEECSRVEVAAVVITGAGRAFCVGQDLDEVLAQPEVSPSERLGRYYIPNLQALRALAKPVIAAVNGPAAGAGIGFALASDIRIGAESASFTPGFVAIGLIPDAGTSWFAARLLGPSRALAWLGTNRKIASTEALGFGLINEVTRDDEVRDRALEFAAQLASMPGNAVALTKQLIEEASSTNLADHLERESELQDVSAAHPAYREQVDAFIARRSAPR